MAIVAQLVEHRVVILDVAGSNPVGRPLFSEGLFIAINDPSDTKILALE